MKKLFLFYSTLLISSALIFTACGKKSSGGSGSTSSITSLTIAANKSTLTADGFDKVTFSVTDQAGNDVTAQTIIYLNNYSSAGYSRIFSVGEHGTYKVTAKKGTVTSNEITLTVNAAAAPQYSTKVIAEDFTGAWCGWCPRLTYKFENFMANNHKIITIGVHNGDALALSSESSLRSKLNPKVTSFPTVFLNRTREFNDNGNINSFADSTDIKEFLQKRSPLGLAINSTISGSNLNITTKVGFDANISDKLRLVVMVLEDGKVLSQSNYYHGNASYPGNPYYSIGNPATSFVHNGVLRAVPTGIFGEDIVTADQTKNNIKTYNHTVSIAGMNPANLRVVAFVNFFDATYAGKIINAQVAPANSNKNFD
ncbi:MAG TPA: Omp28-related outer membrane protein [Chitinophagaceae bacterium]|nr:Omp28-related outer membrane protein [Chitinophagaceae bacterium]HNF29926.1 Omp28-related outer membrane protein [Chitinophagaceae bacterium]HNJ58823.1 Omp28-related outer membrane protein [Chitinophagaceae bacterium]HNL82297.1 Omp28-related outer membrane protein [Chitinophagaceae bacterium]HNM35314.1 Omp28-related outer membrane protein [Chitinophagaceae bacterium]